MNKVVILDIEMTYGSIQDIIHPVVLCDDSNCVLVDCGYVGSLPKIEEALRLSDIAPKAITHIILTHQDHDHIGAAAAFKRMFPAVKMMASAIEAPYISGVEKSLRLEQAEQMQKTLPPEQQAFGEAFCNLLRGVEPALIDHPLYANDLLPFCGGCQVLATPGHTPGHISLYLPWFDAIISGDAIALENGKPVIANPQFTLDMEKAIASMQRLFSYHAKRIICYHGGTFYGKSQD
ncbi:MAG: MBL fold metallo-hydrolase [Clostridiaceae bacterium]|nr:MBL fold metallo-hydrolase [Clostridiaceae bacterium]